MKRGGVFAITGVLAGSLAGVAQHAAPQPAALYTYQGTVHSMQAKTGTLELITGVGHALRLVQMRVPTGLRMAGTATGAASVRVDRKSTRLKPSPLVNSYSAFCLEKKYITKRQ